MFSWSPAFGLNCVSCSEVFARPSASTDYTLQVVDAFGCTAADQIRIEVQEKAVPNLYVPDAFRPDGNGSNRFFTVYAGAEVRQVRRLDIYDRWGGLVFRREHFDAGVPPLGWDGQWRGREAPPGVYLYLLEVELTIGELVRKTGDVTLVR